MLYFRTVAILLQIINFIHWEDDKNNQTLTLNCRHGGKNPLGLKELQINLKNTSLKIITIKNE